jgi:hypothetical protein
VLLRFCAKIPMYALGELTEGPATQNADKHWRSGLKDHPHAAILLVLEVVVAARSFVQGHRVRHQMSRLELSGGHTLEQHRDVSLPVLLRAA